MDIMALERLQSKLERQKQRQEESLAATKAHLQLVKEQIGTYEFLKEHVNDKNKK